MPFPPPVLAGGGGGDARFPGGITRVPRTTPQSCMVSRGVNMAPLFDSLLLLPPYFISALFPAIPLPTSAPFHARTIWKATRRARENMRDRANKRSGLGSSHVPAARGASRVCVTSTGRYSIHSVSPPHYGVTTDQRGRCSHSLSCVIPLARRGEWAPFRFYYILRNCHCSHSHQPFPWDCNSL